MANIHRLNGNVRWHGVDFPRYTSGIRFVAPGKAVFTNELQSSVDIGKMTDSGHRYWAAISVDEVGLCPSDMAGGSLDFPPGSRRKFNKDSEPAVPGHEFVGRLAAAHPKGLEELAARGINTGDYVVGNINLGDGKCWACLEGAPALDCYNGPAFIGIGTFPKAERWVREETGRAHLPGAYVGEGGAVFVPVKNVHKVPKNLTETKKGLALATQIDPAACAYSLWDSVGLETFLSEYKDVESVRVLFIGSGRVALWATSVLQDRLNNLGVKGDIYLSDIRAGNLERVGYACGIPESHRYLVTTKDHPFSRKRLGSAFKIPEMGKDFYFDVVVDCSGHGTLDQENLQYLFDNVIAPSGGVATLSHTGYGGKGLDLVGSDLLLRGQWLRIGLSPRNNMDKGAEFLSKNKDRFSSMMVEIPGGLSQDLAKIVETGGAEYKDQMEGTVFYTSINGR